MYSLLTASVWNLFVIFFFYSKYRLSECNGEMPHRQRNSIQLLHWSIDNSFVKVCGLNVWYEVFSINFFKWLFWFGGKYRPMENVRLFRHLSGEHWLAGLVRRILEWLWNVVDDKLDLEKRTGSWWVLWLWYYTIWEGTLNSATGHEGLTFKNQPVEDPLLLDILSLGDILGCFNDPYSS